MSHAALCIAARESFMFRLLQQFSAGYSLQSCSDLVGVAMIVSRVFHLMRLCVQHTFVCK